MNRQKLYEDRLTELGWTDYRLAQEVAAQRREKGDVVTTQQIYSAVRKCLQHPNRSQAQTNDEIIEALGGQQIIKWEKQRTG